MMSARRRAYEGKKRTPQQSAIEAHDQAYLHGDVRNIAAEQGTASASHATPSGMPVSRQWVHDKLAKVTDEQLKRMIVEMAEVNKRSWSGETIAAATSGPRGSVQQVMASLQCITRRTIGVRTCRIQHTRIRRRGRPNQPILAQPTTGGCTR